MSKNIQNKKLCVHLHVLRAHKVFLTKINFICDLCKNYKIRYENMLFHKKWAQEVSLAHLVMEVDVQPSHPGSSLQRREFGFLF
jgi:hypothetical protein